MAKCVQIRHRFALGIVVCAMVLITACAGSNEPGLTALQTDVEALREELELLREQPARESPRAPDPTTADPAYVSKSDIEPLEAEIARLAAEMEGRTSLLAADAAMRATLEPAFTLQLLHASDMDGAVGALENVENFSAILDGFRLQFPNNTLVLSSGDNYIPGPRYYAASDVSNASVLGVPGNGRADIAFLNAMGFKASALGNHELDHSPGAFAAIISAESEGGATYAGALFPYLSSNLDFARDENLQGLVVRDAQEATLVGAGLARSAVVTVNGERIGIVGATTPTLPAITASGDISVMPADSGDLDSLTAIIQGAVNELTGQGIDKVVLLSHMQRIDIERALAARLDDVDIIVAGGSNTLLADETDRLWPGDAPTDTYPLRHRSRSGEPVLLVNTDGDYRYLGRLVVQFDHAGRIVPETVDPYVSGVYATHRQGAQAFSGTPIPEVSRIARSLREVLVARDGNIIGRTAVYLAGRRSEVRTQETNLGNITADANLWLARQVDPDVRISIKNAGGIRSGIGAVVQPPGSMDPSAVEYLPPASNPTSGKSQGDISQFEIEGALRFNNGLVILPLTPQQLIDVLEHAVGFDGVGDVADGRFPQVAGMRFSFDPAAPPGQRIQSAAVLNNDGSVDDIVVENGALVGDPERRFKIVTLNFLANGGDDYPFPFPHPDRIDLAGEDGQFNAPDPDHPDTNGNGVLDAPVATGPGLVDFADPGTEQDAFAEYLTQFFTDVPFDLAEAPPLEDRRIQNLGIPEKTDTVFESPVSP